MRYIDSLVSQLRELLDESDAVAQELEGLTASSLTKVQASDLIDVLKRSLAAATAAGGAEAVPAPRKVVAINEAARRVEADRTRKAKAARDGFVAAKAAYDEEQRRQFGGLTQRTAPDNGRPMAIWKRYPNHLMESYWDRGEVAYGWAWTCRHDDHSWPVTGGSHLGLEQTRENAQRHWEKYHTEGTEG